MNAISYTAARARLAETMDRVCDNHEAIVITRSAGQAVVMMSLEDYNALEETAYLLPGPRNARRLLGGIASLEEGRGRDRHLSP